MEIGRPGQIGPTVRVTVALLRDKKHVPALILHLLMVGKDVKELLKSTMTANWIIAQVRKDFA